MLVQHDDDSSTVEDEDDTEGDHDKDEEEEDTWLIYLPIKYDFVFLCECLENVAKAHLLFKAGSTATDPPSCGRHENGRTKGNSNDSSRTNT